MNRALAILVIAATLSSGCATVFNDKNHTVTITSQSPGAQVTVDGVPVGVTPMTVLLKTTDELIMVQGPGGQAHCNFNAHVGVVWVVLDILFGLLPLVVDAITGAWTETDSFCIAPV